MDVVFGVGMQMVMPVLGGPPQNALLGAALRKARKNELKGPASRVGAVREVAMVPRPDPEHPQAVQRGAYRDGLPRYARPDRRNAAEMDQEEGQHGRIHDVVMFIIGGNIGRHVS
jgi:hypothetical protein